LKNSGSDLLSTQDCEFFVGLRLRYCQGPVFSSCNWVSTGKPLNFIASLPVKLQFVNFQSRPANGFQSRLNVHASWLESWCSVELNIPRPASSLDRFRRAVRIFALKRRKTYGDRFSQEQSVLEDTVGTPTKLTATYNDAQG
jgi:hypothetical protein